MLCWSTGLGLKTTFRVSRVSLSLRLDWFWILNKPVEVQQHCNDSCVRHYMLHIRSILFDPAYLPIVTQLISFLLALVGSDQQLESVLAQQFLCDIRSEVATPSTECVGTAALMHFGVAPQNVNDLQWRGKTRVISPKHQLTWHDCTYNRCNNTVIQKN